MKLLMIPFSFLVLYLLRETKIIIAVNSKIKKSKNQNFKISKYNQL